MKTFIREDLSEYIVPPRSVVKHLNVKDISSPINHEALLDGLLWSCHPDILSVNSGSRFNNEFIKVSYLFVFQLTLNAILLTDKISPLFYSLYNLQLRLILFGICFCSFCVRSLWAGQKFCSVVALVALDVGVMI